MKEANVFYAVVIPGAQVRVDAICSDLQSAREFAAGLFAESDAESPAFAGVVPIPHESLANLVQQIMASEARSKGLKIRAAA